MWTNKWWVLAVLLTGVPMTTRAAEIIPGDPAPPPSAGEQRSQSSLLSRFDSNHNGVLDAAERDAIRNELALQRGLYDASMLAEYDLNGDGKLDANETRAMKERRAREFAVDYAAMVARNDTDGDNKLDAAELAAMRARHKAFLERMRLEFVKNHDTNHDSIIDGAEQAVIDSGYLLQFQAKSARNAGTNRVAPVTADALTAPAAGLSGLSDVTVLSASGLKGWQSVEIRFALGRAGAVSVKVFDAGGRTVRVIASNESRKSGLSTFHWDGRSEGGQQVASGLYLISVEALGSRVSRKVPVLR